MIKETKFFRKQADRAERMARAISDEETSQNLSNLAQAYRSQADALKKSKLEKNKLKKSKLKKDELKKSKLKKDRLKKEKLKKDRKKKPGKKSRLKGKKR
jgi:hypothetical protein